MTQGKGRNTGQVAYIVTWKNMHEPSLQVEVSVNSRGAVNSKGGRGVVGSQGRVTGRW
jgi:hypothetical protein